MTPPFRHTDFDVYGDVVADEERPIDQARFSEILQSFQRHNLRVASLTRVEGDLRVFLAAATGFGAAGMKDGKPFLEAIEGEVTVERFVAD